MDSSANFREYLAEEAETGVENATKPEVRHVKELSYDEQLDVIESFIQEKDQAQTRQAYLKSSVIDPRLKNIMLKIDYPSVVIQHSDNADLPNPPSTISSAPSVKISKLAALWNDIITVLDKLGWVVVLILSAGFSIFTASYIPKDRFLEEKVKVDVELQTMSAKIESLHDDFVEFSRNTFENCNKKMEDIVRMIDKRVTEIEVKHEVEKQASSNAARQYYPPTTIKPNP